MINMIQEIIVALLIGGSAIYVGLRIFRKLRPRKSEDGCSKAPSGCGGCGEDCTLRDLTLKSEDKTNK